MRKISKIEKNIKLDVHQHIRLPGVPGVLGTRMGTTLAPYRIYESQITTKCKKQRNLVITYPTRMLENLAFLLVVNSLSPT